tara:strand:+ start:70 stop:510 length:441 start_codon:yes stop_codon:yes gene_type:complete
MERYKRELEEFEDYNKKLGRMKELEASLDDAHTDTTGRYLFDKFREQEQERAKLRRELNQRALSNPALDIPPVGPATPPPVAPPTLPPTYNEKLMQQDIKTFTDMGSSIPPNEINEIKSISTEKNEETPEEKQIKELKEFAENQMG